MSKYKKKSVYGNNPVLKETSIVSDIKGARARKALENLYTGRGPTSRGMGTILNAVYTQNRAYFFITRPAVDCLVRGDLNYKTNTINGSSYCSTVADLLSYCIDKVNVGEDFLTGFKVVEKFANKKINPVPSVYKLNAIGRRNFLNYGWDEKEQQESVVNYLLRFGYIEKVVV